MFIPPCSPSKDNCSFEKILRKNSLAGSFLLSTYRPITCKTCAKPSDYLHHIHLLVESSRCICFRFSLGGGQPLFTHQAQTRLTSLRGFREVRRSVRTVSDERQASSVSRVLTSQPQRDPNIENYFNFDGPCPLGQSPSHSQRWQ